MNLDELLAVAESFGVAAYYPEYTTTRIGNTRLGGLPNLAEPSDWPRSKRTGQPMSLLFQLETATLPFPIWARREGVIQIFGPTLNTRPLERAQRVGAEPGTTQLPLEVRTVAGGTADRARGPEDAYVFDELGVQEWQSQLEVPELEDLVRLADIPVAEVDGLETDYVRATDSRLGDKFGGWPWWRRGSQWPVCSCGNPMLFLFQFDEWLSNLGDSYHRAYWENGGLYVFCCENCDDGLVAIEQ